MLTTSRLKLRQWRDDDLPAFAAMGADPEVMEFFPSLLTPTQSNAVAARLRARIDEHNWGFWAVEVLGGPAFIGFVGLNAPTFEAPFMPCTEIGWRIAREHWGKGYATEAARAALEYGFEVLGENEIVAFAGEKNARSRNVMTKIGMTHNTADDFDHPLMPVDHPHKRHVLYRKTRGRQ